MSSPTMPTMPMIPPGFREKMFGSVLIATWVNSLILMFEIIQSCRYFSKYARNDSRFTSCVVGYVLLLEVVSIIPQYVCVYLFTVTYWGDFRGVPLAQTWPFATVVFCSGMVAISVQTYLIRRYYTLSKNWVVSIVLLLITLTAFVGAMYDFGIIVNSGVTQGLMQSAFGVPTTIWMVTTAVADWCVAIALVYQLQRMKNAFKNTKRLIRRLSINAIQSGSLSSVVATLLIMFFFIEDSNIITALCFVLSRTYSLTLLFNVNYRRSATATPDNSTELSTTNRAQFTSVLLEPNSSVLTPSINSCQSTSPWDSQSCGAPDRDRGGSSRQEV
ncbi:hypothetical protein BDV98DRAFT_340788 [Pterulicium gracile]|uniref:DUF6534 domain-containing protein n=1 Tax=Pterulicium gracile TaxID=1884261 RepID=A0A5C3Q214_9AGAR|nr:hypothetical protein BDV98DRAFT_340788 [Pterula gracilis]